MPANVIDEPLAVHFWFPDGSQWTAALDGLPNPALAVELAQGLAMNAHPHGGIGSKNYAEDFAVAVRRMVIELSEAGFTGTVGDLTRATLMRYWLAGSWDREERTRMLLSGFDEVTGALQPEVRAYLEGKPVQARPRSRPYVAYTDGEWERLEAACREVVEGSWRRHQQALRSATTGEDPRSGGSTAENIAWLMLRDGPMSFHKDFMPYIRGMSKSTLARRGLHKVVRQVREDLFPNRTVQIAYSLLFGTYCGIVPDGIDDLELGGVEWAGDTTVLLTYLKGRTARESAVIPKRAVRLLERWLKHSDQLRRFAEGPGREQLWIAHTDNGRGVTGPAPNSRAQRRFSLAIDLLDDAGQSFSVHRGRIRATYEERLARRGWTGRATIDPNHSPRTEGDHYVTPTTPAQLETVESIIEDGQSDLLRKALPTIVLTSEQAAEFAEGFPNEVKRLSLDTAAIVELVGGERDVFTAACADQLAGVHGPAGQPCPARPWVCLLCPLAVFLPRHAANLLRLNAFFSRQFRQMPTENYLRVFGPYADRLVSEILPKLSDEAKAKGELEVTDDDSELPLRPEEATL
ncbi:hypothetical protein [Streptomyces cyaneofuscatus]|uniref:hypothetical protein n=1 Tax=Streptomyces cyaneofuscatus TaxID=66883 RepID=UPI0037F3D355